MRTFDFYEFVGVLVPGAVLLYGASLVYPALAPHLYAQEFNLGGLGLFVVLSYAAGFLVQGIGNLGELACWRPFGGLPTEWVRDAGGGLISRPQHRIVVARLRDMGVYDPFDADSEGADAVAHRASDQRRRRDWYSASRQVYAAVAAGGRAARVDVFNGYYGLARGLAAALLLLCVLVAVVHGQTAWWVVLLLLVAAVLSGFRAARFGRHYARELFVQFLLFPADAVRAGGASDAGPPAPTPAGSVAIAPK